MLISIHSAALMNMLWMKPGSGVVQIHVEGTHLGSVKTQKRNYFLVRECGAPFHMLASYPCACGINGFYSAVEI